MKSVSEKSTQFSVGRIGTYVLAMLEEEGEEVKRRVKKKRRELVKEEIRQRCLS